MRHAWDVLFTMVWEIADNWSTFRWSKFSLGKLREVNKTSENQQTQNLQKLQVKRIFAFYTKRRSCPILQSDWSSWWQLQRSQQKIKNHTHQPNTPVLHGAGCQAAPPRVASVRAGFRLAPGFEKGSPSPPEQRRRKGVKLKQTGMCFKPNAARFHFASNYFGRQQSGRLWSCMEWTSLCMGGYHYK